MIFAESLWQPQKINHDLTRRVAINPESIVWYPTNSTGICFACFESDDEIQEHPVTMLTRFDPDGFFSYHEHPGGEEILVLDGCFTDEIGEHPPGTYMLNPEGFRHTPRSDKGCLTFVKLRQHGGTTRQQVRTNIFESPWQAGTIPEIELQLLYSQTDYPEKVWIERWQIGAKLGAVIETDVKEIYVIAGTWSDELGTYPTGSWLRYPPNCEYNPRSETGCTIYVKTYPTDSTQRFILGKNVRKPELITAP